LAQKTPITPETKFRIGSVTKQFTAAALLQLVEQGKVKLDDDIHVYLPAYNSQGRKISVRRLLDHTSGIKGYTEMPIFEAIGARSLPRDTLVKLFSKEPFDFEPGEEQIYNNSAFFLAGLIIEKASGMPYEQYVQKNLFEKAGMGDSYYCSERVIHKGKVTGYDADSAGFVQKTPISHQWPYAAGSLCSSPRDLVKWNTALHRDGKILGAEAYKEMVTPGALNDGTVIGYGKGIAVYPRLGHKTLHHGGGIPGYLTMNIYFPDDSLSVVVIFNSAKTNPDDAAMKIAEFVLGAPPSAAKPIDGDTTRFVGTFAGKGRGQPMEMTVSLDKGEVLLKAPMLGDSARALTYVGGDEFRYKEMRLLFSGDGAKRTKVRIDAGYGNNVLARK
jgi:CubicO group peptidase (beta-lactamase class C family)